MTVAEVVLPTAVVSTVKLAVVPPSATVTLAGTVAAGSLLDSVTTAPPAGAALLRVTVPFDEFPPTRLDGLSDTDESTGGLSVKVPVFVPL